MIEMRWVLKPDVIADIFAQPVKTLQYRQWMVRLDAGGAITPLPAPIEWSNWQDVPTVKDEGGKP